jgi:hypothetical protein
LPFFVTCTSAFLTFHAVPHAWHFLMPAAS